MSEWPWIVLLSLLTGAAVVLVFMICRDEHQMSQDLKDNRNRLDRELKSIDKRSNAATHWDEPCTVCNEPRWACRVKIHTSAGGAK